MLCFFFVCVCLDFFLLSDYHIFFAIVQKTDCENVSCVVPAFDSLMPCLLHAVTIQHSSWLYAQWRE